MIQMQVVVDDNDHFGNGIVNLFSTIRRVIVNLIISQPIHQVRQAHQKGLHVRRIDNAGRCLVSILLAGPLLAEYLKLIQDGLVDKIEQGEMPSILAVTKVIQPGSQLPDQEVPL
jgi:hypothetical protein